jgi:hypothetical protein
MFGAEGTEAKAASSCTRIPKEEGEEGNTLICGHMMINENKRKTMRRNTRRLYLIDPFIHKAFTTRDEFRARIKAEEASVLLISAVIWRDNIHTRHIQVNELSMQTSALTRASYCRSPTNVRAVYAPSVHECRCAAVNHEESWDYDGAWRPLFRMHSCAVFINSQHQQLEHRLTPRHSRRARAPSPRADARIR